MSTVKIRVGMAAECDGCEPATVKGIELSLAVVVEQLEAVMESKLKEEFPQVRFEFVGNESEAR